MALAARQGYGVWGMLTAGYGCWLLAFLATSVLKTKVRGDSELIWACGQLDTAM